MCSTRNSDNALVIFSKYPEPGKVKTRLAQSIGFELAAITHRYFIQQILQQNTMQTEQYDTYCAVTPVEKLSQFSKEFTGCFAYFPQLNAPDLGARLEHATQFIFAKNYKKVAIIGTDSPGMPVDYVQLAFQKLEKDDLIMGPTTDGGYFLIAMKKNNPSLFAEIRWSTAYTLQDTLKVAATEGLKYSLLPEHFDVDEASDLQHLIESTTVDFLPAELLQELRGKLQLNKKN